MGQLGFGGLCAGFVSGIINVLPVYIEWSDTGIEVKGLPLALGYETCLHVESYDEWHSSQTVHSGAKQAKVSASSLFAEVPTVVPQNGEQEKMQYPRQKRGKNQDPPNYYQDAPEVSRPN